MSEIIAGKYEVMETIGRGGMGTVYKARQTNLDRIVAIKMLSEELASDPEFRARFQQEATVVARLNHPNIVQVHDIEPHNNTFCIIMEFVDGENLQAKIDRDVTLPEQEVVGIGAQVGRALAYAHSRGIIHRDIKPDNIHVTPKGVAKVMDFGIARLADSKLKTQTGISMGTPKFMSPEQVTGRNVDGQTDLYSLGICMYYCLAGRPPFDGENAISVATRHLYEQPELPSKLNSSISPAVEAVILKALEKQKPNRYLTGTEMAEALDQVLGTKTPVRLGTDADERFAGATQKMARQDYGTVTEPDALDSGSSTDFSRAASEMRFDTNSNMTPLREGSIPELDADFRTPNSGMNSDDPTQSFRLSLMVFGGLVIAAVVLLIILVLWLRRSDSRLADMSDPAAGGISSTERIEAVDAEADRYVEANEIVKARNLWAQFHQKYPDVQAERVNRELQTLTERLPVSELAALAELRYKQAFYHLDKQERALALAYLKAASNLSPNLARSAITTNTIQNLQRKLNAAPTAADANLAQTAMTQAVQQMENNNMSGQTEGLLVQAVEMDYSNPVRWESLGDFFFRSRNLDGARVMYGEAVDRSPGGQARVQLVTKLRKITNQEVQ